jgi:hypothetical protein
VKSNTEFRLNVSRCLDKFLKGYKQLHHLGEKYEKKFLVKTSNSLNARSNSRDLQKLDVDRINKDLKKKVGAVKHYLKVILNKLFGDKSLVVSPQ